MMATVRQAYRFALDPTPAQARALASHCGAARWAYNWGLALVKQRLDRRATDPEVEVPWTLAALRREWNRAKDEVAPWWADNSKEAYSSGLDGLARALKNWAESRSGKRTGRKVGFPRFKRRHAVRAACRFTTGVLRVEPDRRHVTLPRLGRIRTHESTHKLARRLEAGTARVLSATVSRQAQRWHVSFTCEVQRAVPPRPAGPPVGVDVGVKHLAVLSTGEVVANPRHLDTAQRRLARANRRLARRLGPRAPGGGQRVPSAGWQAARTELRRAHARVANLRRDGLHKLTTKLTTTCATIVVEDLNVAGMVRNRRLARRIADAGLGELRRQLAYKTTWHGSAMVVADRWYPSSKTCSGCGWVKAKLTLAERVFRCEGCGLVLDRDLNAARNLASLVAWSGRETQVNARGPDVRPGPAGQTGLKREAGTSYALDETGTVGPQGLAARHVALTETR
jgi:IS605 OrfB family transposase